MKWFTIKTRFKLAYRILFGKYKHFIIIRIINESDFIDFILKDEVPDIGIDYLGMREHQVYTLIDGASMQTEPADRILAKAAFEGEAQHIVNEIRKKKS